MQRSGQLRVAGRRGLSGTYVMNEGGAAQQGQQMSLKDAHTGENQEGATARRRRAAVLTSKLFEGNLFVAADEGGGGGGGGGSPDPSDNYLSCWLYGSH